MPRSYCTMLDSGTTSEHKILNTSGLVLVKYVLCFSFCSVHEGMIWDGYIRHRIDSILRM